MSGPRLVGIASAAVVALCAGVLTLSGAGEDGIRGVIRLTARTSLVLFLLAFTASAVHRLWPRPRTRWLLANRRYLGLSFAASHGLHLLAVVALAVRHSDEFWDHTQVSTIVVGGIGYVFVALMAATSNDTSVVWLGPRRWKLLHTVGAYWIWQIFLVRTSCVLRPHRRTSRRSHSSWGHGGCGWRPGDGGRSPCQPPSHRHSSWRNDGMPVAFARSLRRDTPAARHPCYVPRTMRRLPPSLVAAAAIVACVGGCQLLPERYALNAPLGNLMWGGGIEAATPEVLRQRLRTPEGFSVALWADDLPNARFLRFTPAGDLLVSQPREGKVTLLERDRTGDGRSDGRTVLLADLDRPHGLDLHDAWLWVAETGAVGRIRFDPDTRTTSGSFERVVGNLPRGGNHWTRTIRVGPDDLLYVSIGSSCNVCVEEDRRRAAIVRYRLDGGGEELFATGLRNAVGFDWKPGTDDLYATDNGRDLLGDDFPPCELNRVVPGGFYGWPVANGDRVPDPDLGQGQAARIAASIPPAHGFRAHTAPLGMTFVRGTGVPPDYRGAALVALHGSWNRTKKDGYAVVSLHWQPDGTIRERDFLTGFLRDESVIGRPVDVAEGPDGAFYVSDDYAGAIYRVAFGAASRAPAATPGPSTAVGDALAGIPASERTARAARGAQLYRDLGCASCHEAGAAAPGMVTKPLADLGRRWTVDSLATFLAAPTPPMPAVEGGPDARRDLAIHLLATHP